MKNYYIPISSGLNNFELLHHACSSSGNIENVGKFYL